MNYQTMQFQAREKQQQLRQEAQHHRSARQSRSEQNEPSQSSPIGKLAAAVFVATVAATLLYII